MGKEMDKTVVRDSILDRIVTMLTNDGDDPRPIKSGEVMMPVVDDEGNEFFAVIKVTIPRGKRENGTYKPYDGYAAADDYAADLEAKQKEKEIKEKNKKQKAAEKKRVKEAKQVVKNLNTKGFKTLILEKDDDNQFLPHEVEV